MQEFYKSFEEPFPNKLVKIRNSTMRSPWITLGIKVSCEKNRLLFETQRTLCCPVLTDYYKKYYEILRSHSGCEMYGE